MKPWGVCSVDSWVLSVLWPVETCAAGKLHSRIWLTETSVLGKISREEMGRNPEPSPRIPGRAWHQRGTHCGEDACQGPGGQIRAPANSQMDLSPRLGCFVSWGENDTEEKQPVAFKAADCDTQLSLWCQRGLGRYLFCQNTSLAEVTLCSPGGRVTTESQGHPAAQPQCFGDGHTITSEPPWRSRAVHGQCPRTGLSVCAHDPRFLQLLPWCRGQTPIRISAMGKENRPDPPSDRQRGTPEATEVCRTRVTE